MSVIPSGIRIRHTGAVVRADAVGPQIRAISSCLCKNTRVRNRDGGARGRGGENFVGQVTDTGVVVLGLVRHIGRIHIGAVDGHLLRKRVDLRDRQRLAVQVLSVPAEQRRVN